MLREALTSPPARPGANAGRERLDVAALRAHPREQERRARHELAHAREVLGDSRAGDGADVGQARLAQAARAEPVDDRGEALPERLAVGQLEVLDVGGARVGGADEHEDPGALRPADLQDRVEHVAAHERVDREGVGAEAGHIPERALGVGDQALGVDARDVGHVAALDVCEDEQAGGPRVLDRRLQCVPAGSAQTLEEGDLRLDGHTGRAGGVDQQLAVRADGGARPLGGGAAVARR